MAKIKSPSGSFKNWKFTKFLLGQEKALVVLVGLIGSYLITQNPALSAIISAAGSLLYAMFKYLIKVY